MRVSDGLKKMTVLNIRMSESEKEKIKEKADKINLSVSAYARRVLLESEEENAVEDNTSVIQAKDDHIADLQSQIDGYKVQIEQLHTIILATQRDNQLLIEAKSRRWWQF
jgi:hypothetical protein